MIISMKNKFTTGWCANFISEYSSQFVWHPRTLCVNFDEIPDLLLIGSILSQSVFDGVFILFP